MKKNIFLAAGAVLVAAAVSVFVCVSNERNSMDELFNANVEALANNEGGGSQQCYCISDYGPIMYGIFCDRRAQYPSIYPCSSSYYDRMGGISSCY